MVWGPEMFHVIEEGGADETSVVARKSSWADVQTALAAANDGEGVELWGETTQKSIGIWWRLGVGDYVCYDMDLLAMDPAAPELPPDILIGGGGAWDPLGRGLLVTSTGGAVEEMGAAWSQMGDVRFASTVVIVTGLIHHTGGGGNLDGAILGALVRSDGAYLFGGGKGWASAGAWSSNRAAGAPGALTISANTGALYVAQTPPVGAADPAAASGQVNYYRTSPSTYYHLGFSPASDNIGSSGATLGSAISTGAWPSNGYHPGALVSGNQDTAEVLSMWIQRIKVIGGGARGI